MIDRNVVTAPVPAVGAVGEQSSLCNTNVVADAAAESKPEIKAGPHNADARIGEGIWNIATTLRTQQGGEYGLYGYRSTGASL